MLLTLPTTLQALISTVLWASSPKELEHAPDLPTITFHLRHQHATTADARIIFADVLPSTSLTTNGEATIFSIPTRHGTIPQPPSLAAFNAARLASHRDTTPALDWHDWAGPTPDVSQRSTLLQLAQMAFNTYAPSNTTPTSWYPLLPAWRSSPFGWEPTDDGMRGHVFVASDNKTVVIATKGTSAGWLAGDGGPTVGRDKRNDNLMFSCCCARVGPTWSTVCGCWDGGYRCDTRCVEEALVDEGLFYPIGLNLYNNVSYMYPNANIWLTGHSLGGGLSALMGATFGVPVVAFEAPGEKLASRRLHLPAPPSLEHITHVYHTADPIPMGTCTGVTSLCALGGFALETRCHTGQVVRFDTVSKLGWSVDVRTHGIGFVIEKLLGDEGVWREEDDDDEGEGDGGEGIWRVMRWGWGKKKEGEGGEGEGGKKRRREVPRARPAEEVEGVDGVCTDCYNWEFGEFRNSTR